MKQKNLVILCGVPGSGKSYWVKHHLGKNDIYVSRDEIRFSLLGDNEDYFAYETQVFDKFVTEIEENLNKGLRVFADATHINWASRRKLLQRLHDKKHILIDVYIFNTPIDLCIERNASRKGRAQVPISVIKNMFNHKTDPHNDPYKYHIIKEIKGDD